MSISGAYMITSKHQNKKKQINNAQDHFKQEKQN
jgi:hypothetical protein